jgi:hypothetical protein
MAPGELGRSGEGAATLSEGLAKIADGRLAPETLTLQLHRPNEGPNDPAVGWLLRLEAGTATVETHTRAAGYGEPRTLPLSPGDIAELARLLADASLETLPGNLYAPRYTDLTVEVLARQKVIQARRFADIGPETYGESQRRFDRVVDALERLRRRIDS